MTEKKRVPRLMVINEPDGRRFSKALAMEIGRDHAEVFLQIEFLISISTTPIMDGQLWTRQSVASLQEEYFPYWGRTFISDLLADLCDGYNHVRYSYEGEGRKRKRVSTKVAIPPLLTRSWFNLQGWDTTTWYSLRAEGIATLQSVKLDAEMVAVTATRKRVTAQRSPVTAGRSPVSASAGDFITETPTETPTEGGALPTVTPSIPEPPPNFPNYLGAAEQTQIDPLHLETEHKVSTPSNMVVTRSSNHKTRREKIAEFLGE